MKKLNVGILGIRGIPANYGGFETFAEELSSRLVSNGHTVTVYSRQGVVEEVGELYRGVVIKKLPTVKHKYLETIVHTALCCLNIVWEQRILRKTPPHDVLLVCNAANSPLIPILRLGGFPVLVNVDGIERKRAKWNFFGRLWYRLGELSSVLFASELISDAEVIRQYYYSTYKTDSNVIAYGYNESRKEQVLKKLNSELVPTVEEDLFYQKFGGMFGNYILYVSRLEPENHAEVVIEGYNLFREYMLKEKKDPQALPKLFIVGDAPYSDEFKKLLHSIAGDGVKFLGYQFGDSYQLLQLGALLYVQATDVGGTHPALVESMGFANCIIANSTPENREVLGDSGIFYEKNTPLSLAKKLSKFYLTPTETQQKRTLNYHRAQSHFSWTHVTQQYETLFSKFKKS
jgi:glycosyltransferase involved in cell wall biosynthesis